MQNILADQRKRVRDSHRVQMAALGHKAEEGEEVGISVAGDTHINITSPPKGESSMLKKALPIAATLLVGGALPVAGFLLNQWLNRPTAQAPATAPADSEYEIRFYDKDGNLVDVPRHAS